MPARAPGRADEAALDRIATAFLAMTRAQQVDCAARLEMDLDEIERAIAGRLAVGWRADPLSFVQHLEPGHWRPWRYSRLLSSKFRQLVTGESKRQLWALPARYGKTSWSTRNGPAWALDYRPTTRLILATYAQNLARESAVNLRDFLLEHSGQLRVHLRPDFRRQDRWRTDQQGGLLATGIQGSAAGFPADGFVIDDPFKDIMDAHMAAKRERAYKFATTVARLRLETEDAWMLVCGYRLHTKDLHARLQDESGEAWDLVSIPAVCADPETDPLGRALGEPIEPERFSLAEVQARAAALGPYEAASMEQQAPSSDVGSVFRRDWWQWYSDTDDALGRLPDTFDVSVSSWDMKLSDRAVGDYAVGQVWGRRGADYYLRHQWRGRWDAPTVKAAMALARVRFPDVPFHYYENTGRGPDIAADLRAPQPGYELRAEIAEAIGCYDRDERDQVEALLRRGLDSLLPVAPRGSKFIRAQAHSGVVAAGHCWLPADEAWSKAFVNEFADFDGSEDTHDDQVDTWSQAMSKLRALPSASVKQARRGSLPTPSGRARGSLGRPVR